MPEKPDLLIAIILAQEPDINAELAAGLARVFQWEVDEIMRIATELTKESTNSPHHFTLRDEMVLFYAQFLHHLGTLIVTKNGERGLVNLDPRGELERATSSLGKEKIGNTAKLFAEHVLIPTHEKWRAKTQSLVELQAKPSILPPRAIWTPDKARKPRTRNNHYVPQFLTRSWADSKNEVMVFSRRLDGSLAAEPQRVANWASESNLYSQHIEDYFSSVERHAAGVYRKLLRGQALSGPDRQN